MVNSSLPAASVLDNGRLAELKRQVKSGDPAAAKEVARQFESLFMQMVLKAMRDAVPREGLFDNQSARLYESLHDQQLSLQLGGGRGLGLAGMIERQLATKDAGAAVPLGPLPLRREPVPMPLDGPSPGAIKGRGQAPTTPAEKPARASADAGVPEAQRAFVERLMPAAMEAERKTGIPAHFMVAQAALESGWGRSEPLNRDGGRSFNIFGIKAGRGWHGPAVEASTTEVIAGLAQSRVERFRSYASYEEAFQDYAELLASSPRYAGVVGANEPRQFARGLQAAGYATDPAYATKIESILDGTVLRRSTPT